MLLTPRNILRPIARMRVLIIEQPPDAQLLRRRPVPARPIPRTRRLMPKNPIQPVAVVRGNRGV